jgi:hypothetical protein
MYMEHDGEWSAGSRRSLVGSRARFTRVESRRQMAVYLRGPLSETERKNGWTLAEAAGDAVAAEFLRMGLRRGP